MPAFAGMTTFPAGLRPRGLRGMARRKAQTYGVRDPFGTTAGASRRANRGRLRHRALLFPRLKLGQLAPSRTWEEWLTAAIGVWVFISPWGVGRGIERAHPVELAGRRGVAGDSGALVVLARARIRSDRNAPLTREPKVRAE